MTTSPTSFPRLKSAGVQGAKVVGREQLTKIGATHKDHSRGNGGEAGESGKSKGNHKTPVRK